MPKIPRPTLPPDSSGDVCSQDEPSCRFCWKRFSLKCGAHGLGWPFLVLIFLLLWLRYVGIPQPLVQRVQEGLQSRGVFATVDHVYYSLLRGLSVRGVQLDVPGSDVPLSVYVDDARLLWNPLDFGAPNKGIRGLVIRSGKGRLDLSRYSNSDDRMVHWQFHSLSGRLNLSETGVEVASLSGHTFGFDVDLSGDLVLGAGWDWQGSSQEGANAALDLSEMLRPLVQALELLQSVEYQSSPLLTLDFYWNAQDLTRNKMDVSIHAEEAFVLQGITFDALSFEGSLRSNIVHLAEGSLVHEGGRFSLQGDYSVDDDSLEGSFSSTLPPTLFRELLPREWLEPLEEKGFFGVAFLKVEMAFPRADRLEVLQQWRGHVSTRGLDYRGVWVDHLSMDVARIDDQLSFSSVTGMLGRDRAKGSLSGHLTVNLSEYHYAAQFRTGFHPSVLLPVCPLGLHRLFERFSMNAKGPKCQVDFSGRVGVKNSLRFSCELDARNFSYNGAHIDSLQSVAVFSNRVVRLDPLFFKRSEGALNGFVELDFSEKLANLGVVSFVNPAVLAAIIHPKFERLLRPFEFKGDSFLRLDGRYDYGKQRAHDLYGTMYVEQAGPDRLLFEDCCFQLDFETNVFRLVDMKGTIENGPFEGFVQVNGLDRKEDKDFQLDFQVADADLRAIVDRNFALEENSYSGFLNTQVALVGQVGTNWLSTLSGRGGLSIRDGELFRMPLFGGLSRLLSKMFRGFGYASQGDFKCTFLIEDEFLKTDDVALQGATLSVTGRGALGFDKSLDFKVQVRPLREGVIADVFRLVLSPLTKLFEFKLSGDLSKPRWRPDNLPKELFLKFD